MTAHPFRSSPAFTLLPLLAHLSAHGSVYLLAGVLLAAAVLVSLTAGTGHRRPPLALDTRVRWRLWPGPGFIRSRWMLRRRYGLPAARRIARRGRPSLTPRERLLGPWQEYASFVGWAHGPVRPARVYSTLEQVRLVIAPPQKGKSAAAVGSIIDAPGPVVATSIRGDLIAASAGLRQRSGRIHIFNPEGAGRYGSTMTYNLVYGCQDVVAAVRRAGSIVEGSTARGLSDAEFWQDLASMTLAAYLHAAGLTGGDLGDVTGWISDEDPGPVRILSQHPGADEFALRALRHYLTLPDRTRASIYATLTRALRFMQHPQIAAMLCPPGPGSFNVASFLRSRDTLYLVASDAKETLVPPVFTTIISEIAYAARFAGGAAGRLDPPLCLELDEIANVAPVPVAAWATWAAGSGVRMNIYSQAFAQLAERWGEHGAEVIWQAADMKVIYTGTSEPGLSSRLERACGDVRLRGPDHITPAAGGRDRRERTWTREQVLPAAMVAQLPPGRAIVLQGGSKPVIVRTERYWKRADVKHAAAPALPAPGRRVIPEPMPGLRGQPAASAAAGAVPDELTARRLTRQAAPRSDPADPAPGNWPVGQGPREGSSA